MRFGCNKPTIQYVSSLTRNEVCFCAYSSKFFNFVCRLFRSDAADQRGFSAEAISRAHNQTVDASWKN